MLASRHIHIFLPDHVHLVQWLQVAITEHPQVRRAVTVPWARTPELAWKARTCLRYPRGPFRKETLARPAHTVKVPVRTQGRQQSGWGNQQPRGA